MVQDNVSDVIRYYRKFESKLGYRFLMGGVKHFGLYEAGDFALNFRAAHRRMEDLVAKQLDLGRGSHVLDAGCGTGAVACHQAGQHGLRVQGIDVLDFNLRAAGRRIARAGLQDHVSVARMDYSSLAFRSNTFDGIYTVETLVHSSDPEAVLSEFLRTLRPGGALVMLEYSRDQDETMSPRANWAFEKINSVAAMPAFQRLYHGRLEEILKRTGFTDIRTEDLTERMLPMLRVFSALGQVPYAIATTVGHPEWFINAMSGVELYRYRKHFRYNLHHAIKPT